MNLIVKKLLKLHDFILKFVTVKYVGVQVNEL